MPGRPRYTGKREQHLHKTLFYCPSIDMTVTYRDMKYAGPMRVCLEILTGMLGCRRQVRQVRSRCGNDDVWQRRQYRRACNCLEVWVGVPQ